MSKTILKTDINDLLASGILQEYPHIAGLLEELLKQPAATPRAVDRSPNKSGENEVLLDVHLNGKRYTLMRAEPPSIRQETGLSPREREIVRLVAKGLPNKTIADILDISQWTVATHLKRIFAKMEVRTRTEMVARAMRDGL